MAFYRGEQGTVFFDKDSSGGVSEIAAVRSWSMTVEKDVLETTAQGATYKANIGGLVSGTGSMEVMYDAPGSGDKLDLIKDVNTVTDEGNASVELYLVTVAWHQFFTFRQEEFDREDGGSLLKHIKKEGIRLV